MPKCFSLFHSVVRDVPSFLAAWNGTTQSVNTVTSENDTIYVRDLTVWNGAGQYVKPVTFQYDSIYENDLAAASRTGEQVKVAGFAYDVIYQHDLTAANGGIQNVRTARLHNGIQDAFLWNSEAVIAFA
jgi:hypothetical protein